MEKAKRGQGCDSTDRKKIKEVKQDYKQLLEAFQKSERVRKEQKELISQMKKQIVKLKEGKKSK